MEDTSHKRPHIISFRLHEISRITQSAETASRLEVAGAGDERTGNNGYGVSFGSDEDILEPDQGGGCTAL